MFGTRVDPETGAYVPRRIYRWDRSTQTLTAISRTSDGTFLPLSLLEVAAVSEHGGAVAFLTYANFKNELWIWNDGQGPTQKTPATIGSFTTESVDNIAISADGSALLFATRLKPPSGNSISALVRYSPSTNQFSVITSGYTYSVSNLSVSDSGALLCYKTFDQNRTPQSQVVTLDASTGTLRQVDVSSSGTPANASSDNPQISGNGRYVVFDSPATNLVAVDFNGASDVFGHDLSTGITRKLSNFNDGSSFSGGASLVGSNGTLRLTQFVSTDGSRVLFGGGVTNLVWDENGTIPTAPSPTSPQPGLSGGTIKELAAFAGRHGIVKVLGEGRFVQSAGFSPGGYSYNAIQDSATGGFEYIDVASGTATTLPITADNRTIIFATSKSLVPSDSNTKVDLYLRDRQANLTTRLTQAFDGSQTLGDVEGTIAVSDDGQWVAVASKDISLMPNLNGKMQVFLMYVPTRALTLISKALDGGPANGIQVPDLRMSTDGRYVAFVSDASNLTGNDNNPASDVFRYDRLSAKLERVSLAANGANFDAFIRFSDIAISGDGSVVAFATGATNVVPGEDPNAVPDSAVGLTTQTAHRQRSGGSEVFLYDFKTKVLEVGSVNSLGERPIRGYGNVSGFPYLNFDGTRLAFQSTASDLVAFQATLTRNVFLRDRTQGKTFVASYGNAGSFIDNTRTMLDRVGRRVFFISGTSQSTDSVFVRDTAPQPTITSPLAVNTVAGRAFTYQIVASPNPTSYSATGLPAGLALDTVLGVITGKPTQAGTAQVTLNATNASGTTSVILNMTVQAAPLSGPVVVSGSSATARTGQPFSFQVRVRGVTSAARVTATGLPAGLTIDSATGIISGIVNQEGGSAANLTVTDGSASTSATLQLTFTSDAAVPIITSSASANLQQGQSFTYAITAPSTADANDPTTYSISGTLPQGLVFDPSTGTISGTYSGAAAQKSDGSSASTEALTSPTSSFLSGVQLFAHNSHGTATTSLSFLVGKATSALNISTRMSVGTGDNALFAGFIVTGTAPKKVVLRGGGPSLKTGGTAVPGRLTDTVLELHGSDGSLIIRNDDWRSTQQQAIIDSTIPPTDDRESAIVATLQPGNYTAILTGKNNTTGIGLVEVYDLDIAATSQLAQISTRGKVLTGDDVMIGGFILSGGTSANVLVRAIGPTLPVNGSLQDTTLELYNGNGDSLGANDDWRSDQEQAIIATTVPPNDNRESAILRSLTAGNYTAIVRGKNNTTGVGLVEVYVLQ